jgi:hypothetical protein
MFEDNPYLVKVRSNLGGEMNLQNKIDRMLGKNQPQDDQEE